MGKFKLEDYATVDERISLFYKAFEGGRIVTERVTDDPTANVEVFKAYLYRTPDEQSRNLPLATGYALETRDEELSINKQGYEYASVNYSAWLENCETSAIGRALANAGFTGNKNRPSREEMEKVERVQQKAKETKSEPEPTQVKKKEKPKAKEEPKPEKKDDSDSSGGDVEKFLSTVDDKTKLIEWWKGQMDNDKDGEFRKQYQKDVFKKLEELK